MIRRRHPSVARQLVNQLQGHPDTPFLRAEAEARRELMGVMGSNHRRGKLCRKEPGHPSWNQRTQNQEQFVGDGSMKLVPVWRGSSGRSSSHTHLLK